MLRGSDLKQAYARGENISNLLRSNGATNSESIIEAAYDLQAGSYVERAKKEENREYKRRYVAEIARIMLRFGRPESLFEAGVGEATTLSYLLKEFGSPQIPAAGVDLCWSRVRWARQWLQEESIQGVNLAVSNLTHLPFADAAFDFVYTSHSIEPNGGSEQEILTELHRVTARYLILLEPGYELAGPEARARMEHHGYCRDLCGHAERLGMKVLEHRLFPMNSRPENPTALTIIEKTPHLVPAGPAWACPECHSLLESIEQFWYCKACFLAYPVLNGLPCLRPSKGIIASQLLDYPTK